MVNYSSFYPEERRNKELEESKERILFYFSFPVSMKELVIRFLTENSIEYYSIPIKYAIDDVSRVFEVIVYCDRNTALYLQANYFELSFSNRDFETNTDRTLMRRYRRTDKYNDENNSED